MRIQTIFNRVEKFKSFVCGAASLEVCVVKIIDAKSAFFEQDL